MSKVLLAQSVFGFQKYLKPIANSARTGIVPTNYFGIFYAVYLVDTLKIGTMMPEGIH